MERNRQRVEILLLTLLGFYFFIFGNWFLAITSPDEGKNAYAALHMLTTGDWIVPYYNCQYRFEKPPLLYWLTALNFKLFGVNEFSARLISGLSALGISLITYLLVRDFLDPKRALLGGIAFILFIHTWVEARAVVPEMLLVFFSTLGVYLFLKGRTIWGWIALALAFLAKGPVGVFLPLAVLFLWKTLEGKGFREALKWFLGIFNPWGLLAFLSVALPWYLAVIYKVGWSFFYKFFVLENVARFTGKLQKHLYPWWYYLPIAAVSSLLFWPAFLSKRLFERRVAPFWGWFAFVLLFYSLSKGKLHHYILFAYPALAAVLANTLSLSYIKRALTAGFLLLSTLLAGAYFYNTQRFVPKAVEYLKRENPQRLFFYGIEESAIVFYLNRCIFHLQNPSEVKEKTFVITSVGDLKDFKGYQILAEGKEGKRKEVLILLGGDN